MTTDAAQDWAVERYRDLLRLHARQLRWDARLRGKFDESDLVQMTLLRGHEGRADCRANDEAGRAAWLRQIMRNLLRDQLRHFLGPKHDARLEQTFHQAVDESSSRFEGWLAAGDTSP